MRLCAGKYYVTRDGRRVGPMRNTGEEYDVVNTDPEFGHQIWNSDGTVYKVADHEYGHAIVAEFVPPVTSQLKVGDTARVVKNSGDHGFSLGSIVQLVSAGMAGMVDGFHARGVEGGDWFVLRADMEPYAPPTKEERWREVMAAIKQMLIDQSHEAIDCGDSQTAIDSMKLLRDLEKLE